MDLHNSFKCSTNEPSLNEEVSEEVDWVKLSYALKEITSDNSLEDLDLDW